jgi:putative NADH-flavin reductase
MRIVLFGAGGRVGPDLLGEAERRGHSVTVAGRVTDPDSVAAASDGQDAAISAIGDRNHPEPGYLAGIARTLLAGLEQAGLPRLIVVGGSGGLEVAPGVPLIDTPEFNADWRPVAQAHIDALEAFRSSETPVDWVVLSPAGFFEQNGERTGRYRVSGDALLRDEVGNSHISYADYAIAMIDELERPAHHRTRFSVAD